VCGDASDRDLQYLTAATPQPRPSPRRRLDTQSIHRIVNVVLAILSGFPAQQSAAVSMTSSFGISTELTVRSRVRLIKYGARMIAGSRGLRCAVGLFLPEPGHRQRFYG
jgi:hypothetical protein